MLSFTRAQIRPRAQRRADMEGNPLLSTAEWNDMFNEALGYYWTIMDDADPEFSVSETTVTTVAGTLAYALPATFRRLLEVYADEGSTQRRPILPVDGFSRARYVAPQGAYNVIVRYKANAPQISDDVTTVALGELGDAYVVRLMAKAALEKETVKQASIASVSAEIADLEDKIRSFRRRDGAFAPKSRNVEMANILLYPYACRVRGYALVGDNIELFQPLAPYYF